MDRLGEKKKKEEINDEMRANRVHNLQNKKEKSEKSNVVRLRCDLSLLLLLKIFPYSIFFSLCVLNSLYRHFYTRKLAVCCLFVCEMIRSIIYIKKSNRFVENEMELFCIFSFIL